MRRIVFAWLIDWPVTVWSKTAGRSPPPDDQPFALIESGAAGLRLRALNDAARALGLRRGQSHADARAAVPHLVGAPAEPARELEALRRLALWSERWSPAVALDDQENPPDGLFLDMTGAAHLFGGETRMLTGMRARLAAAGVRARLAIAPTPGAAWAAARWSGADETVIADAALRSALAPLPVASLRLDDQTVTLARRLGLKQIGDLYALPRAGLARRFRDADGLGLVRRLDQALGMAAEPLIPLRVPPSYRVWETFADPLTDTGGVAARLEVLAVDLVGQLDRDGRGARRLTLWGFRTDGEVARLSVRMGRASRAGDVWFRLFRERGIERLDLGFGVDALMLTADLAEPMTAHQAPLDDREHPTRTADLSDLVDRLSARLGETAVQLPQARESWLPERSEIRLPALEGLGRSAPEWTHGRPRPLLLLSPPEPVEALAELPDGAPARFTWRRVSRRVARAEGPERLAPEWWRSARPGRPSRARDYYRIEDEDGVRYWLFREGLYEQAEAERPPSWWMHGLFP